MNNCRTLRRENHARGLERTMPPQQLEAYPHSLCCHVCGSIYLKGYPTYECLNCGAGNGNEKRR